MNIQLSCRALQVGETSFLAPSIQLIQVQNKTQKPSPKLAVLPVAGRSTNKTDRRVYLRLLVLHDTSVCCVKWGDQRNSFFFNIQLVSRSFSFRSFQTQKKNSLLKQGRIFFLLSTQCMKDMNMKKIKQNAESTLFQFFVVAFTHDFFMKIIFFEK